MAWRDPSADSWLRAEHNPVAWPGGGFVTATDRPGPAELPHAVQRVSAVAGTGMAVSKTDALTVERWPAGEVPRDVADAWTKLLALSDGPCPVAQSPGAIAVAAVHDGQRYDLLVVRTAAGAIVGVQPARFGPLHIGFRAGRRMLFRVPVGGVALIGTEPLVARSDLKGVVARALLDHLDGVRAIEFGELQPGSVLDREIAAAARDSRALYSPGSRGTWSFAHVPPSLDAYNAGLDKKKRYNLKRQERLLAEHLGGELELSVIREAGGLPLLTDAIRQLTGWPAGMLSWAERDAELSCREGIACCFVLRSGDRLIGLIRATAWGDKVHIHSMHRDVALDRFSAGTALWQAVLRWLIEGGVFRSIVFAYGDPGHANRATNVSEVRIPTILYTPGLLTSPVFGLHRLFARGRSLMKSAVAEVAARRERARDASGGVGAAAATA